MRSPDPKASYDVFVSYARRDDTDGLVSAYVEALKTAYLSFTGDELRVFFDKDEIDGASDWEMRIRPALRDSKAMIAFLSPAYFTREWCRREWELFSQQEASRFLLGEGIRPLEIVDVPALKGESHDLPKGWIEDTRKRQFIPLCADRDALLRALETTYVRSRVAELREELTPTETGIKELHGAIRWVKWHVDRRRQAEASPSYDLPVPNRHFVGRTEELRKIRQMFADHRQVAIATEGIGGVGKTELAIMYTHAFAWDYPGGRYFIKAEGRNDLLPLLAEAMASGLRVGLSPDDRSAPDGGFLKVRRHWESLGCPKILAILDNVDVPQFGAAVSEPILLRADSLHALPSTGLFNLIATGRGKLSGSDALATIPVGLLSESEALLLIEDRRPLETEEDRAAATDLVRRVGRLTLAVEIVSVYLGIYRDVSVASYSAWLQEAGLQALDASVTEDALVASALTNPQKLISTLFHPTFERLTPPAKEALAFASLMAPDYVVEPWLRELVGEEYPEVLVDAKPRSQWSRAMDELRRHRILEEGVEDPRLFRIHRLMSEVVAALEPTGDRQSRLETLAHQHEVELRTTWVKRENRWEIGPLAALCERLMNDGRWIGAGVANGIAAKYSDLGNLTEARRLLRRAIEIQERAYEPDHPALAISYSNLALVEQDLGNSPEARRLLMRAIGIQERAYEPDHPHLAISYSNLAMVERGLVNLPEARRLLRRAIEIDERTLEPDNSSLAISYSNLAVVEQDLGNLPEARGLLKRAVEIGEWAYEPDHPHNAIIYAKLAMVEKDLGNSPEARRLLMRAIGIQERAYEPDHPHLAISYSNLAMVERGLGNLAEAKRLLGRAIEIEERAYEPDHPHLAISYSNLAMVEEGLGNLAEAKRLLGRAIEIQERAYEPDHPALATSYSNLALVEEGLGNLAEAKRLLGRAIEIQERAYEPDHPALATSYSNLALVEHGVGNLLEARRLLIWAIEIEERAYEPDHPTLATSYSSLALVEQDLGNLPEARRLLERAIAVRLARHPADDPRAARYRALIEEMGL